MVKVISLSEEAYKVLRSMKKGNMSFSDVIVENFNHFNKQKTENLSNLIDWLESIGTTNKKEKISKKIDEIVYGVKK